MPKLSIIIPVYNVEDYVEQCVNSIVNQTLRDIEIIIIDDESSDKSMDKVRNIHDSRIKIIRQKNKGLSGARNAGLKLANGEYITFVDSDDYIAFNNAYEDMYKLAIKEKSDVVAGNCLWYYSESNKYPMKRDKYSFCNSPMKAEIFFIKSLETHRTYAPVWLNIYKRQLIFNNNIYFKEGIYHEDEDFMPRILLKAKNVSIYNEEFYVYRQRNGSIMNSGFNIKKCTDMLDTCLRLEKLLDYIENERLKYLLQNYIVYTSFNLIYDYKYINVSEEIKKMIINNANTKLFSIRSKVLNLSVRLYIVLEKIIITIRKINNINVWRY